MVVNLMRLVVKYVRKLHNAIKNVHKVAANSFFICNFALEKDLNINILGLTKRKKMNVETIGNWAGLVWNALNEVEVLGLKQVKKATKLKDKELYAAIGWLARESKLNIEENAEEKEVYLSLVK